jgi:hypothetical protein
MSVVPQQLDTDRGPPMAVPLRHFLVGFAFLLAGAAGAVASSAGLVRAPPRPAYAHLLVAGWVCLTILGAMTQFVPVWSGTRLFSRRAARAQLWLVAVGVGGLAAGFWMGAYGLLLPFGLVALAGFWTFVANVALTLASLDGLDVTERHFAVALGFLVLVTTLGATLAAGYAHPAAQTALVDVGWTNVVSAHATLAVFGVVLTTVFGALYQLVAMFTQSPLSGVDYPLQRVEEVAYPAGVLVLATGRLVGSPAVARTGGLLALVGVLAFAVVLLRRLRGATVEGTPMLRRYAVAALALVGWALATVPAWAADPLTPAARFGPESASLLLFVVVAFVVVGTLYHVVPFIVWVDRYSDRLGLEPVPTIDDLYDGRLALADLTCLVVAAAAFVADAAVGGGTLGLVGRLAGLVGVGLFVGNLTAVVVRHARTDAPEGTPS